MKTNFFHVYILRCNDGGIYTGFTQDLDDRLDRHNRGSVPSTKNRRPVKLIFFCSFVDKYQAYAFEKYLKTGSGRAFCNKRFL